MIYGRETGEETWTQHLQGFVVFKCQKTFSAVKRLMPRCHIEETKGSPQQNIDYCSKQGNIFEKGVRPKTPAQKGEMEKRRYEEAFAAATEGRLDDIPKDILTRHYSTYKRIQGDYQPKPLTLEDTCGVWIYGPPGTGKSHEVNAKFPSAYQKNINKWWDGYKGEDVVWIDEVAPEHMTWIVPFLKKWADKFPFPAEAKGSQREIRPAKLIITSNYSLDELGLNDVDRQALGRRFSERKKTDKEQQVL